MAAEKSLRSSQDSAKRLLILASICFVAHDNGFRSEIVDWLKEQDLWQAVSPNERQFLEGANPTKKENIKFSWYAEAVYIIGWALGLEQELLPPNKQASSGNILDQMPAPGEPTSPFISSAKLREAHEIYAAAEGLYNAHSRCVSAKFQNRPERHGHDIEVA